MSVLIKKYSNRRLYNTETSSYITLDDLADLIRRDHDVQVVDAKSGEDLTQSVLLQIIADQERDLLPLPFLKMLIRMTDPSMRTALQRYLSHTLDAFINAQRDFDRQYRDLAGRFLNPMSWMQGFFSPDEPRRPTRRRAAPEPMVEDPPPSAEPPPATEPPPAIPTPPEVAAEPRAAEPPPPAASDSAPDPAGDTSEPSELELLRQQMAAMQRVLAKLEGKDNKG